MKVAEVAVGVGMKCFYQQSGVGIGVEQVHGIEVGLGLGTGAELGLGTDVEVEQGLGIEMGFGLDVGQGRGIEGGLELERMLGVASGKSLECCMWMQFGVARLPAAELPTLFSVFSRERPAQGKK